MMINPVSLEKSTSSEEEVELEEFSESSTPVELPSDQQVFESLRKQLEDRQLLDQQLSHTLTKAQKNLNQSRQAAQAERGRADLLEEELTQARNNNISFRREIRQNRTQASQPINSEPQPTSQATATRPLSWWRRGWTKVKNFFSNRRNRLIISTLGTIAAFVTFFLAPGVTLPVLLGIGIFNGVMELLCN